MPFHYTIVLIAAVFTLSIIHLRWAMIRAENAGADLDDSDPHLSTVLAILTPLTLLFYTEEFWKNLFYLLPVYLYMAVLLRLIVGKRGNIYALQYLVALLPGGMGTAILFYLLFFHDGVLTESSVEAQQGQAEISSLSLTMSLWPYAVYMFLVIYFLKALRDETVGRSGGDRPKHILLAFIIIFPILALFTDYYWWTLLAALVLNLSALHKSVANEEVSVRGGMGFLYMYVMMMTYGLSILLYAILY